MRTKVHLCLAVMFLCLCAARAEAREFTFDFSAPRIDTAAATVPAFVLGDTINLSLPEGQPSFSLLIVAAPPAGIAGPSYIAKDSQSQASAVVKPTKDGLRITVDDFEHQKIYSARVQNGIVETSVHDTSDGGDDVCGTCAAAGDGIVDAALPSSSNPTSTMTSSGRAVSTKPPQSGARLLAQPLGAANAAFDVAEHNPIIDVLVAFDQGAKAWVESSEWPDGDTIAEFADYAVSKMNYVLEQSQLLDRFSYRLVGVVEVDATYAAVEQSVLLALQSGSGALAKVAAMREKCGADTTTLLVNRTSPSSTTTGVGFALNGTNDTDYASFAAANKNCNVCHIQSVYGRYTMSHETGHNMGCGHSNTQQSAPGPEKGPFPYSCGYHFTDTNGVRRHTVMAYQSDGVYSYQAIPYFSSPDIVPDEYGVPLGLPGTNDNRQVLVHTHNGVSTYCDHVVPYDWDVRFVDSHGNDIPDGAYFAPPMYVTLTNSNPNAVIYYAYDGETPTSASASGTQILLQGTRTITACAVVGGVAQSMRTVTFINGLEWSGELGQNGNGVWKSGDSSVRAWNDSSQYFLNGYDTIRFPDIDGNAAPTVTVNGVVAPTGASFMNSTTAYTFEKGSDDALIHLRDASFSPSGDLTFNVPVQFDAVAFTNPASHTLTFNAPFGQTLTETTGSCTNMIGIGSAGTLVVAPGAGKTQYFDSLSTEWFFSSARFCVGEGTVVFKGPADSSKGVFGNTGIVIGKGGNLVLDFSGSIAGTYSSIACEGTITFKAVATANSKTWWTASGWRGTVAFDGLSADTTTQNFQFEKYGNADSRILLRNCAISYLSNNNAVFPGTLVLDGADALRLGNNGYSSNWNVIGALEGDGSISASSQHTQTYVFNTATNYTGAISIGVTSNKGRRIVFGSVSAAGDIPSQTATITVKSGATASIGGGATWNAYHGVEVGGTLLVKGAHATLDCNVSAAMGLKLNDGAMLRFEAVDAKLTFAKAPQFVAGTVNIAFAAGVAPTNGMVLVQWPDGTTPSGDFAFADSALAGRFVLNKTATGLVVGKAPLPATVNASITVRYWGDDGWEDRAMSFKLPTAWVTNYYPSLDTPEAVAAKYNETAANGATVWQCYMLGLDPTNAASTVSLSMTVAGNEIRFAVDGLGETHALDGIQVQWALNTSTNLVTDTEFSMRRDYSEGLVPAFPAHPMPDKPTASATQTVDKLFYKLTVSFIAEETP